VDGLGLAVGAPLRWEIRLIHCVCFQQRRRALGKPVAMAWLASSCLKVRIADMRHIPVKAGTGALSSLDSVRVAETCRAISSLGTGGGPCGDAHHRRCFATRRPQSWSRECGVGDNGSGRETIREPEAAFCREHSILHSIDTVGKPCPPDHPWSVKLAGTHLNHFRDDDG
jgi:hypothetical protein